MSITFIAENTAEAAARIEALVCKRYAPPLYEAVPKPEKSTVEIRLNLGPTLPFWVEDAPGHAALCQMLHEEFGEGADTKILVDEEAPVASKTLYFRPNPYAQHELFVRHVDELPDFIASFFPILDV